MPAPVEAAILKAPELPFICFAVISFVVTIAPDVFTFVIAELPSCIVLDVPTLAPLPSDVAL